MSKPKIKKQRDPYFKIMIKTTKPGPHKPNKKELLKKSSQKDWED